MSVENPLNQEIQQWEYCILATFETHNHKTERVLYYPDAGEKLGIKKEKLDDDSGDLKNVNYDELQFLTITKLGEQGWEAVNFNLGAYFGTKVGSVLFKRPKIKP